MDNSRPSIMLRRSNRLGPFLLVLSCVGCATGVTGGTGPSDPVAQQMQELRAQIVSLQKKNTVTEIELQRLRVKVAELEVAAREQPAVVVRSQIPPAPSLAQVGPEDPIEPVRVARIETEDLVPESTIVGREVTRPAPVEAIGVPPTPPDVASENLAGSEAPPASTTAPAVLSQAAQALYDQGYTEYNQRQFVASEATFQRYLQRYGATSLADNAQYWIGEARYGRGDARGALAAYRETVSRFPEGNKAPDALLRAGRVLEEMGSDEAALVSYREVVSRFPNSANALLAGDRIRALGGN